MSNIQSVTIAGSGVLGAQIAFQTAFHGFDVTVYDISDEMLEKAKAKFQKLGQTYQQDLGASPERINQTIEAIRCSSDLNEAIKGADLMIEAIPENPKIKTAFYKKLGELAPPETIFATNSSTLLPSQFAEATGRPSQFLALHFANEIWKNNTAEIMGHKRTDEQVFNTIVDFAESIGMMALPLHKEQPGYILNSLLVPLLTAALELKVKDVAEVETIDKTWMVATGAPLGPFGILDVIGINTVYNVNKMAADKAQDPLKNDMVKYLKESLIDQNKLGVETGEGFYSYPNPTYKDPDFLK
ncbi:MAG: 3-hydroxyacyl-CoA dehydrogenase [Balneolaceae bacterium]|nr:3-hydroxyacyl-CoA dehydrogenase [Balneolaceae bacterium]MDZ7715079.1 3-hydroxyacyl-CoA dehydrogenase [Balneolaceae bacterium]